MPNINAAATDTTLIATEHSTWSAARGASSANTAVPDAAPFFGSDRANIAVRVAFDGSEYTINRTMMAFDVSGVSKVPASATLKIYGYQLASSDVVIIKVQDSATGDTTTNFVVGDYSKVTTTKYSAENLSWQVGQYNEIPLNLACRAAIQSQSTLKIAIVNSTYDFSNSDPGTTINHRAGMYFAGFSDANFRPFISYIEGTSTVEELKAKRRRVRSRGGRTKGFSIGRVASPAGGGKVVSNGFKTDGY